MNYKKLGIVLCMIPYYFGMAWVWGHAPKVDGVEKWIIAVPMCGIGVGLGFVVWFWGIIVWNWLHDK